jgi:hypothetical protein
MVIPLAESAGKVFDGPDATVIFDPAKGDRNDRFGFGLRIQSKFETFDIEADKLAERGAFPPADDLQPFLMNQFFLWDVKGHNLHNWTCGIQQKSAREAIVSFAPVPLPPSPGEAVEPPPVEAPTKLLFHSIIRTTTEVMFDFHDVPLP